MPTLSLSDGATLHYSERGHGSPVLFIHGTQPDADIWEGLMAELALDNRAIAYDRRGFSRSSGRPSKEYARHAADAAELLRHLVVAPAIVVGWSWGGIVALELVASEPKLVSHLILIEPALHLKRHPSLGVIQAVVRSQLLRRMKSDAAGAEAFLRWALRRRDGLGGYDQLSEAQRAVVRTSAASILKEIDAGTGESLSKARIASIGARAMIMHGDLSDMALRRASERLARMMANAETVSVANSGHAIHLDAPALVVAAIRRAARP